MNDEIFIKRCVQLARLGAGKVAPNPMVGAVLVYNDTIIGEGCHMAFGEAHAEVNCIKSVLPENRRFIPASVLYVSLEPCAHFGKTPPCADFIIQHQIKKVVIGCKDIFAKVNGLGIEKMRHAGINVVAGVCEDECMELNKRFFTFHEKKRPYVILKWSQTAGGFIGHFHAERLFITNEFTNRLTHRWRAEEAAIAVGTNTAILDNPSLTNRFYAGKNPVRMFADKNLQVPATAALFNNDAPTVIFNAIKNEAQEGNDFVKIAFEKNVEEQILQYCFEHDLQSIIIEGGARFLQSFINKQLWDECRVITNQTLFIQNGVAAPALKNARHLFSENIFSDRIDYLARR